VLAHALLRHAQRLGQLFGPRLAARAQLLHDLLARRPEPDFKSGYHDAFMLLLGRPFVNRTVAKYEKRLISSEA
jgi:hypothetical protein